MPKKHFNNALINRFNYITNPLSYDKGFRHFSRLRRGNALNRRGLRCSSAGGGKTALDRLRVSILMPHNVEKIVTFF